jgi:Flp pilus assembly protein TadB
MTPKWKLGIALGALAILAGLAWQTIDPGKWRNFVWLVLAFFAFRVVIGALRSRYDREDAQRLADSQSLDVPPDKQG